MAKTWIFGDVHGAYKALKQIFERAPIEKGDTIISLGDICDGWSEVYECVDLLIKMQQDYNMIFIKGNHCDWFNTWLKTNTHPAEWGQGGVGTLKSYCDNLDKVYYNEENGYKTTLLDTDIPISHINFFRNQLKYYKDENNNLFVHGGFNRHFLLENQQQDYIFWWDRDLWYQALSTKGTNIKLKIAEPLNEIFIGHTTTQTWKKDTPMNASNIWNLDTGCGYGSGKLTIMNLETKEFWQSDPANELYPNEHGR